MLLLYYYSPFVNLLYVFALMSLGEVNHDGLYFSTHARSLLVPNLNKGGELAS